MKLTVFPANSRGVSRIRSAYFFASSVSPTAHKPARAKSKVADCVLRIFNAGSFLAVRSAPSGKSSSQIGLARSYHTGRTCGASSVARSRCCLGPGVEHPTAITTPFPYTIASPDDTSVGFADHRAFQRAVNKRSSSGVPGRLRILVSTRRKRWLVRRRRQATPQPL